MLISYYTVYHVEINGKGSVGCLSFFRDDKVHPTISQVIFVGQFQPLRPDGRIKFGLPTISDAPVCTLPIRIGETIHGGLLIDRQPEQIKMNVLPSLLEAFYGRYEG